MYTVFHCLRSFSLSCVVHHRVLVAVGGGSVRAVA